MNKILFSSNSEEWATPIDFYRELNKEFNFTLDPCASSENAKCKRFFTKAQDGLSQSWKGERVFCNPPYGKKIAKWVEKAYNEAKHAFIVMLLPVRTDTVYFHDFIYGKAEIRFIKGRLHFNESKAGAPFPSMLVIYNIGGQNNDKEHNENRSRDDRGLF